MSKNDCLYYIIYTKNNHTSQFLRPPIIKATMTKAHPPPPTHTADDVPHACTPLAPLTNGAPPADNKQQHGLTNNKPTTADTTLKTMKLCRPHPCSLDVLPSPTNKWSMTTHPVIGRAYR